MCKIEFEESAGMHSILKPIPPQQTGFTNCPIVGFLNRRFRKRASVFFESFNQKNPLKLSLD